MNPYKEETLATFPKWGIFAVDGETCVVITREVLYELGERDWLGQIEDSRALEQAIIGMTLLFQELYKEKENWLDDESYYLDAIFQFVGLIIPLMTPDWLNVDSEFTYGKETIRDLYDRALNTAPLTR